MARVRAIVLARVRLGVQQWLGLEPLHWLGSGLWLNVYE